MLLAEGRQAESADARDLVLFHGEEHLARTWITRHDAQLVAQQVDLHRRLVARRAALLAGADDHLLCREIARRTHPRIGAHITHVHFAVGAAEIGEPGRIEARLFAPVVERIGDRAGQHGGHHSAVARRDVEDMRGGDRAPRACHVGHHHGRAAGDISGQIAADEPTIGVVATARRAGDNQADAAPAIEIGDGILGEGRVRDQQEACQQQDGAAHGAGLRRQHIRARWCAAGHADGSCPRRVSPGAW